jgi:NADP-dependent 3-hydroxy acid dehydrogenase YdfG
VNGTDSDPPVGIVTGAASGIGAATAIEFARLGARMVLASLPSDDLAPVAQAVRATGGEAVPLSLDVRDNERVEELSQIALQHFGRIDFLFANAGVVDQGSVAHGDPEKWRRVIETNLLGAAFCVRAVLPTMIEQARGDVVLTASVSGRETYVGEPIYIASKWGLVGFGHALRQEVAPLGIRVTLVEPGLVDTPLTRLNPIIAPLLDRAEPLHAEDVARAVVFACTQPDHVVISEVTIRPQRQPDIVAVGPQSRTGAAAREGGSK